MPMIYADRMMVSRSRERRDPWRALVFELAALMLDAALADNDAAATNSRVAAIIAQAKQEFSSRKRRMILQ